MRGNLQYKLLVLPLLIVAGLAQAVESPQHRSRQSFLETVRALDAPTGGIVAAKGLETPSDTHLRLKDLQQENARLRRAASEQKAAVNREADGLKKQLSALREELSRAEEENLALREEQKAPEGGSPGQFEVVQALLAAQQTLPREDETLAAQLAETRQAAEEKQQELAAQLEAQKKAYEEAQASITALSAQLETKNAGPDIDLKSLAARQAYISGVVYSRELQRIIAEQKDNGITLTPAELVAGVEDGLSDQIRMDKKTLDREYQKLLETVNRKEQDKYQQALGELQKATAGKKVVKQNQTLFFVQAGAGKGELKSGDTVRFSLKEETLKGEVINPEKGMSLPLGESTPYLFRQAFELAGKGGKLEIYGVASDFYTPDIMPDNVFSMTPVKLSLKVE